MWFCFTSISLTLTLTYFADRCQRGPNAEASASCAELDSSTLQSSQYNSTILQAFITRVLLILTIVEPSLVQLVIVIALEAPKDTYLLVTYRD